MKDYMYNRLRPHIGHNIVCVAYGEYEKEPVDICLECEDCGEVLLSAEDYDFKEE